MLPRAPAGGAAAAGGQDRGQSSSTSRIRLSGAVWRTLKSRAEGDSSSPRRATGRSTRLEKAARRAVGGPGAADRLLEADHLREVPERADLEADLAFVEPGLPGGAGLG